MFEIQTEAYLRRTNPHDDAPHAPIVPAAIVASLILWATIILTAAS